MSPLQLIPSRIPQDGTNHSCCSTYNIRGRSIFLFLIEYWTWCAWVVGITLITQPFQERHKTESQIVWCVVHQPQLIIYFLGKHKHCHVMLVLPLWFYFNPFRTYTFQNCSMSSAFTTLWYTLQGYCKKQNK